MIDRRGRVLTVSVSDAQLTELPPIHLGTARLRGVHIVHTHPKGGSLSKSDLSTLFLNRLDAVAAVEVRSDGIPGAVHLAHLTPPNASAEEEDWRIYPPKTPQEAEEFDLKAQITALESEMSRFSRFETAQGTQERAILVQVVLPDQLDAWERLEEMSELARTAGAQVAHKTLVARDQLKSSTVIGRGKLEELTSKAYHLDCSLLIFGNELSPTQAREIESVCGLKVLDRTQLILDIFALHARGQESELQVELAQLRYLKPRLLGQGTSLSRLGGGIGTRGPGETKLEMDRRRINNRIAELEKTIERLSDQRQERRKSRKRNQVPVIGIVGYTNAGKSTLLNTLARLPQSTQVVAEDKLFATLRPTSRKGWLPGIGEVVFSDTVGFIRDLPKDLTRAFRSTLEELADADLLLHLVDLSTPGMEGRVRSVERIMNDLNLDQLPCLTVLNKIDRMEPEEVSLACTRYEALAISAAHPDSVGPLKEQLTQMLLNLGIPSRDPNETYRESSSKTDEPWPLN